MVSWFITEVSMWLCWMFFFTHRYFCSLSIKGNRSRSDSSTKSSTSGSPGAKPRVGRRKRKLFKIFSFFSLYYFFKGTKKLKTTNLVIYHCWHFETSVYKISNIAEASLLIGWKNVLFVPVQTLLWRQTVFCWLNFIKPTRNVGLFT